MNKPVMENDLAGKPLFKIQHRPTANDHEVGSSWAITKPRGPMYTMPMWTYQDIEKEVAVTQEP
jgi:hypothetical protein